MGKKNVLDAENYTNRELSWLDFNYRVLDEARNRDVPLFERLKFLSITSSNLDEFFMVRVASLKDQVHAGYTKLDIAGMSAQEQLDRISEKTHAFVELQYSTYTRSLIPTLKNNGLRVITRHEALTESEAAFVDQYFMDNVYPVLTPMAVDSSRPFPLVLNKTLNIAALVRQKKGRVSKALKIKHRKSSTTDIDSANLDFAMVQVPAGLSRIVQLPDEMDAAGNPVKAVILLEEIIERNMSKLFANYDIVTSHPFRIMRNADLSLDEEEAVDLLEEIKKQLNRRRWGEVIRLEVDDDIDKKLLKILRKELGVDGADIYKVNGPLDLTFLMKMYGLAGFDALKTPRYEPQLVPELENGASIFENIRKHDIFLSHPYETFDPVVNFIRCAAKDKEVLAIKITLYRVSGNSPIVAALAEAAANGKQVSVLVELKARFDEENNIQWALKLEKAGCHVIYGLVGLKTHSKIALVVRQEARGIRRYVHLATGNYNDSTAKLYTDCGIFTCNKKIGEDATAVFNMLSGYSEPESWNALEVAPVWLRPWLIHRIEVETANAKAGKRARIVAKMNSLCDKEVIAKLYEASIAGVQIDLIVRGICCLKAGVSGLSENIRVRSIVGNFLEHARITYFENDGEPLYYMGSADWMPRNLDRRVEIVFPILDKNLQKRVQHILDLELADNVKASIMQADGSYAHEDLRGKKQIDSQQIQCYEAELAAGALERRRVIGANKTFVPMEK